MVEKYAAKKGKGFKWFLIAMSSLMIFAAYGLPVLLGSFYILGLVITSLITLPVIGFFVWCWFSTSYIVNTDTLRIICDPFRWSIPITDIKKIRLDQLTIGGTAKPTLSWRCLELEYGKYKTISITPENQDSFTSLLKSKNDSIVIK